MRLVRTEHTIGKSTLLVQRSKFSNSRLPTTVGAQKLSQGIWVFGVQIRFTFDSPVGGGNVRRLPDNSKTIIGNDLYLVRSSWHYTDKAGFNPQRLAPAASGSLVTAQANYKSHAMGNRKNDAPDPKNVYVHQNSISIFDGPGKLSTFATVTEPLTTYHIFEVAVWRSSPGQRLGGVKFHFFMEIDGNNFIHEAKVLA